MDTNTSTYRYRSQYEEIFSCVFVHEYYPDSICTDLIVQPNIVSALLIKNYNLIFKSFAGGFSLAANSQSDYKSIVFSDPFDLDFEFKFKSPYFFSFSSLSIDPEVRYFLDDDFEKTIHLGESRQLTDGSLDRPGLAGILRLKHTKEHSILPRIGAGIADFRARSKAVFLNSRLVKLVFICYSTGGDLDQFEGLTIRNEGEFIGKVFFENQEKIETASGLAAYKFMSKGMIPMRSYWSGYFILENKNEGLFYSKTLPNPSPQTIKFDSYHNNYISENYVKL